MKTHISLNVRDVPTSVDFYRKVFDTSPQKQAKGYAKFDLTTPTLNFSLIASPTDLSRVNHLGIEVDSDNELSNWERRLQNFGIIDRVEHNVECCYAKQNKLWFSDPDGNHWEVFTVLEQLPVSRSQKETGCCVPKSISPNTSACGCS